MRREAREQAKQGQVRVVAVATSAKRCTVVTAAAFLAGMFAGSYVAKGDPELGTPMPAVVLKLGSYLCASHSGLATVQRTAANRFTFWCKELAVLPNVEVDLKVPPRVLNVQQENATQLLVN